MYDEIMTLAQPSIGNQRLNRKNMKRDGWLWDRDKKPIDLDIVLLQLRDGHKITMMDQKLRRQRKNEGL